MERLKKFVNDLYEHIHLENNVIFPQAVALEEKWVC
jgi:regulator of cell morphogenesis and NO signaling